MRIGIIGPGAMGQTVGRLLAQSGHTVAVGWSSSEARLRLAAEQIGFGTRTATPIEAVSDAAAVLFAPRFEHIRAASLAVGAKRVGGTLVRDAGFEPIDLGAVTESTGQDPGGSYYGEEFHLADVPTLGYDLRGASRRDDRTPRRTAVGAFFGVVAG